MFEFQVFMDECCFLRRIYSSFFLSFDHIDAQNENDACSACFADGVCALELLSPSVSVGVKTKEILHSKHICENVIIPTRGFYVPPHRLSA